MIDWLTAELDRELGLDVRSGPEIPLRSSWRLPGCERYDSNRVIDALAVEGSPAEHGDWNLALTDVDLFAPGRRYVFGEAMLGGRWALVSLARLGHPETGVARLRLLKEAIHEIGHLAGLEHCNDARCVMFPSRGLGDTDRKLASLCTACADRPPPHLQT